MKKKILIYILLALILLGILARILCLNNEITAEESDFVKAAIAIAQTGHPAYYQSEQVPNELALWHPPMYIYLLSIIPSISNSEIMIRSLNVIFLIFTSIIIFLFCLKMFDKGGKIIGLVSSSLFLINYYVLSSSLIVDIDVLSMFFVFSFIYLVLLYYKTENKACLALAAVTFVFSLANRYPIAILCYLVIGLYFIINKNNKKNKRIIPAYVLIGLLGGLAFLVIWAFYSTIIQPGTFFAFITHNINLGSQQFSSLPLYISSFLLNGAQIIRLFTLPGVLLFIISLPSHIRKKDIFTKVILIYTTAILLLFIIIPRPAFGYPRYFLSLMPGFFILISKYAYEKLSDISIKKEYILLSVLCGILSLFMLMLLNPQLTIYQNDGLIKSTNLPDFLLNFACILPAPLVFAFRKQERKIVTLIAILAIFLSYNLYFDAKYVANDSPIKEAGIYLKEHTNNSEIIICPKAVGYYAERRFYANDYTKPPLNKLSLNFFIEYISESYKNPEMDTQFFWDDDIFSGVYYSNYIKPDPNLALTKYIVLNYKCEGMDYEKKIGDYYVYNLKQEAI